jgi:hypothetical protein
MHNLNRIPTEGNVDRQERIGGNGLTETGFFTTPKMRAPDAMASIIVELRDRLASWLDFVVEVVD